MADNRLVPFEVHSTTGTLTSGSQINLDTSNVNRALASYDVSTPQRLVDVLDDEMSLFPFISDSCILDSDGNELNFVEDMEQLAGKTYTLRFNAINAKQFDNDPSIVVHRIGASESISNNIGTINEGWNSFTMTFSQHDVDTLKPAAGALNFEILTEGRRLIAKCVDVLPKVKEITVDVNESLTLINDAGYNGLSNKDEYMSYSDINGGRIILKDNSSLSVDSSTFPVDIEVFFESGNVTLASVDSAILDSSTVYAYSNGDLGRLVGNGDNFNIIVTSISERLIEPNIMVENRLELEEITSFNTLKTKTIAFRLLGDFSKLSNTNSIRLGIGATILNIRSFKSTGTYSSSFTLPNNLKQGAWFAVNIDPNSNLNIPSGQALRVYFLEDENILATEVIGNYT